MSACWNTQPLSEDVTIFGSAELFLSISSNQQIAFIIARLCDIDGETGDSTLITRGVLNLTHKDGHDRNTYDSSFVKHVSHNNLLLFFGFRACFVLRAYYLPY